MGKITVDLLRKRAEHNDMEISTLEEISLHQENLEKIELLDQCCRQLKILYLQNNLISKIENVARLKELDYLNLALNNIVRIENLSACESLRKLDLTVNFIVDITTVEHLRNNRELREMYLTGNPCCGFDGYRAYVVAVLPQLASLDGQAVSRSERILATRELDVNRAALVSQITAHEKELEAKREKKRNLGKTKDTWYTHPNAHLEDTTPRIVEITSDDEDDDEATRAFWQEETEHTPESRLETHRQMEAMQKKEEAKKTPKKPKRVRRLVRDDGTPLNVNEGGWDFVLSGHEPHIAEYTLDLACYRHLDTSLIDADVQPSFVRVTIKGKVFQLVLPESVSPDESQAKRSQVTGHLLITMPKISTIIAAPKSKTTPKTSGSKSPAAAAAESDHDSESRASKKQYLEASGSKLATELASIVSDNEKTQAAQAQAKSKAAILGSRSSTQPRPRANDDDFCDNDDVPPLE